MTAVAYRERLRILYSNGPFSGDRRATSTNIASVFLVVIVLVLAGGIGAELLSVTNREPAPHTVFGFEFEDNGTRDILAIRSSGGDTIDGSRLFVKVVRASPDEAPGHYRWTGSELNGTPRIETDSKVVLNEVSVGDDNAANFDCAQVSLVWASNRKTLLPVAAWRGPDVGMSGPSAVAVDALSGSAGTASEGAGPGGDQALTFRFTTCQDVTVERFAVTTMGDLDSASKVSRSPPELTVTDGGRDGKAHANEASPHNETYSADGTEYPLNTTAEIRAGRTANVNVGNFPDPIDVRGFAGPDTADIEVTLVFADGTKKRFHFDAEPI